MKHLKRIFSFLLCLTLILSMSLVSFAKHDDEEEEDYSVSDVYFDIADNQILVGWTGGDSKTSYTVQLYDANNFTAKNKVGNSSTVSYRTDVCDVTEKILRKGSGTYYAVVTTKKRPKGGNPGRAYGKETISSEDISDIKRNRPAADNQKKTVSSSGAQTGVNGGPGTSDAFTSDKETIAPHWVAQKDGKWSYVKKDGSTATGWYLVNDKWYFSGEDGIMFVSAWIKSQTEEKVWYYVGTDGAMLADTITPDGYFVDSKGKYIE